MKAWVFALFILIHFKSMAQMQYTIHIDLPHPKAVVWQTLTDFRSYPAWNSMLTMAENDRLQVGEKFHVTIINKKGKKSRFKARTITHTPCRSFSARQTILGKWMFSATHHFTLEALDDQNTRFTQTWDLTGILSKLFLKQIFRELALFNQMNEDLKDYLEQIKMK